MDLKFIVPGHALHEKGLQRQIGVDTLVSRQQRRALAVPRLNRGSTARCVPPPVYIGFPLFVVAKRRSEQLFTVSWRVRSVVGFRADRNVGTFFGPALPRHAVRRAPRRPDPPVVCPGFGLDRFTSTHKSSFLHQVVLAPSYTCRIQNPDTQRAGRVGTGKAGQNRVQTFRSARKPTVPLAPQVTVNNCSKRLFASTNKGNPM